MNGRPKGTRAVPASAARAWAVRLFIDAIRAHLIPALAAGAHRGETPWPRRLRVYKIGEVCSLTWNFAGPDGRALFTLSPDTAGEPLLTWLAIGYHDINP